MPYKLRVLPQDGLCLLVYTGKVSEADFDDVWRAVAASDDHYPTIDDLVILAPDADYSDIGHDLAIEQAQHFVELQDKGRTGDHKYTAFVCANDMQVIMTRMFAAYVMTHGPAYVRIETFRDVDSALDWLQPSKGSGRRIDRQDVKRRLREMGQGWCCGEAAA